MAAQLIQTANGYLLCSSHAEAWQRGGNTVSMWPANEQETKQGGGRCADCPQWEVRWTYSGYRSEARAQRFDSHAEAVAFMHDNHLAARSPSGVQVEKV